MPERLARAAEVASRAALATRLGELARLPERPRRRAFARLVAVRALRAWCSSLGGPRWRAAELFAAAWKDGAIARPPVVAAELPRFCGRSVRTWHRINDVFGPVPLAGAYRPRRFDVAADPRVLRVAEAMVLCKPRITPARLHAALRNNFGTAAPSKSACARWLAAWRAANAAALKRQITDTARATGAARGARR
ncbi:hypothetical protein [Elioraea sp.]|uniref:hypothetical protein n=1 Tax=Elioraea sp. TaxID=2185103 RepID=UPI003F71AB64